MKMRFKAWKEEKKKPSDVLYFKLVEKLDTNEVELHAVDEDGTCLVGGYILKITHDGKLYRYTGISHDIDGLSLDSSGRIVIRDDRR